MALGKFSGASQLDSSAGVPIVFIGRSVGSTLSAMILNNKLAHLSFWKSLVVRHFCPFPRQGVLNHHLQTQHHH